MSNDLHRIKEEAETEVRTSLCLFHSLPPPSSAHWRALWEAIQSRGTVTPPRGACPHQAPLRWVFSGPHHVQGHRGASTVPCGRGECPPSWVLQSISEPWVQTSTHATHEGLSQPLPTIAQLARKRVQRTSSVGASQTALLRSASLLGRASFIMRNLTDLVLSVLTTFDFRLLWFSETVQECSRILLSWWCWSWSCICVVKPLHLPWSNSAGVRSHRHFEIWQNVWAEKLEGMWGGSFHCLHTGSAGVATMLVAWPHLERI